MTPAHEILNEPEWTKAHATVAAWKNDPAGSYPCPRCDTTGLAVADQSARPYSEWYELTCSGCRLHVTMHLLLAPPPGPAV